MSVSTNQDPNHVDGQFAVMPRWLIGRSGIGRTELALYVALDAHADATTRIAHPSMSTLAKLLGVAKHQVVREALAVLVNHGVVEVIRGKRANSQAWANNRYRVHRRSPESRGCLAIGTPAPLGVELITGWWCGQRSGAAASSVSEMLLAVCTETGCTVPDLFRAANRLLDGGYALTVRNLRDALVGPLRAAS